MPKFLLGKKLEMTQIFQEDGAVIPVTMVRAGPVTVTQLKNQTKDGYEAIQIGHDPKKKINKPKTGHLKGLGNFKRLKEIRIKADIVKEAERVKVGDSWDVSVFNVGDKVKVSGLSKGKGFQGAVKRHGFAGMPASHGHHHVLRHVGSIGQRFPQHTLKGMRMAGRMGGERITTRGLKIVAVDKEKNILAIKGAIPGKRGALLEISGL